jgi:hypothetical protein
VGIAGGELGTEAIERRYKRLNWSNVDFYVFAAKTRHTAAPRGSGRILCGCVTCERLVDKGRYYAIEMGTDDG